MGLVCRLRYIAIIPTNCYYYCAIFKYMEVNMEPVIAELAGAVLSASPEGEHESSVVETMQASRNVGDGEVVTHHYKLTTSQIREGEYSTSRNREEHGGEQEATTKNSRCKCFFRCFKR